MPERRRPSSLVERFIGACFGLLTAAIAVYIAVRLVEAVLVPLLIIASSTAGLTVVAAVIRRHRHGGW